MPDDKIEWATLLADPASVWYVTTGLLVVELMTGQMQVGHADFIEWTPAEIPVAGDPDDATSPTYASLASLAWPAFTVEARVGEPVIDRVDKDGAVTSDESLASQGVTIAIWDEITGHNIAEPFWTFMNATGLVWVDDMLTEELLFEHPYFAVGRPITEPYWAEVLVGGTAQEVLMQCFERRCLTYTPENPEGWQVEAGNVGLHYFRWRYIDNDGANAPGQRNASPMHIKVRSERPLSVVIPTAAEGPRLANVVGTSIARTDGTLAF